MVEEVVVHKIPVALVMLSGKTYIFVHIKCYNILKGDVARLIHFNKSFVYAKR